MITKLELIEYLKNTPENTNYNILRSGLYNGSNKEAVDEFIAVLSRGNLSLAALQPYLAKLYKDDGSISPPPLPPIPTPGSGGQLPDEVKNAVETHGMGWTEAESQEGFDIQWDGNTEGLEEAGGEFIGFYKVSNRILSKNEFLGGTVFFGDEGIVITGDSEIFWELIPNKLYAFGGSGGVLISAGVEYDGVTYSSGVYFSKDPEGYISRLYKEASTEEVVHQIDQKYLPESDIGYDEISGGNITEVDGKKYLTPLGGGVIRKPLNVEFTMTATEDGEITFGEEPIAEGELIVGETYRVTVNGVTDDYVCFDIDGLPIIGKSEDEMVNGDWQIASFDNKIWDAVFGNVGDEFSFNIVGETEITYIINDKFLPNSDYIKVPFMLVNTGDGYKLCDKNYNEVTNAQYIEYEEKNFGSVAIYFGEVIFVYQSGRNNNVVLVYDNVTSSGIVRKRIEINNIVINPYDADPNSPVIPLVTRYQNGIDFEKV